jgi:hypothetical protein
MSCVSTAECSKYTLFALIKRLQHLTKHNGTLIITTLQLCKPFRNTSKQVGTGCLDLLLDEERLKDAVEVTSHLDSAMSRIGLGGSSSGGMMGHATPMATPHHTPGFSPGFSPGMGKYSTVCIYISIHTTDLFIYI